MIRSSDPPSARWSARLGVIAALAGMCGTQTALGQPRGMSPVERAHGYCQHVGEPICHEWKLLTDPQQRLVAHGDEDGVTYAFYVLDANRRYAHPVRIHPVMKDNSIPATLFWGYAWDIEDIVVGPDGRSIMSTFDHQVTDDGNVSTPRGQKRVPAVMFTGRASQKNATVPDVTFAPMSVQALRAGARRRDARE